MCRLNSHDFPSRRKRGITTLGLRSAAKKILAMCRFTVINAKVVFEVAFEGEIGEGVISGEKSSKTVEQLQVPPCLSASLASCLRLRVATSRYPPPCRPPCCPLCTVQAPRAVPVYPPGCHRCRLTSTGTLLLGVLAGWSKLCITAPPILKSCILS